MEDTYLISIQFSSTNSISNICDALQDMYDETGISGYFYLRDIDANTKSIRFERSYDDDHEIIAREFLLSGRLLDKELVSTDEIKDVIAKQLADELDEFISPEIADEVRQLIDTLTKRQDYELKINGDQLSELSKEISEIDIADQEVLNDGFLSSIFIENIQLAQRFLERGANLYIANYSGTALLSALKNRKQKSVDFLIEKGFDIEFKDEQGKTIFMQLAGSINNVSGLTCIKALGCDIYAKDSMQMNALMGAAMSGCEKNVEWLLKQGYDVNAQDFEGNTALMFAAFSGKTKIVDQLLSAGANLMAENMRSETVFNIARQRSQEVLAYLESYTENKRLNSIIDHHDSSANLHF